GAAPGSRAGHLPGPALAPAARPGRGPDHRPRRHRLDRTQGRRRAGAGPGAAPEALAPGREPGGHQVAPVPPGDHDARFRWPRRVAILGCGTVGREVAARLIESGERLGVSVVKVLVRDASRDRGLPRGLFTASIEDVEAARPELVVELIGGLEPAASLVSRFL